MLSHQDYTDLTPEELASAAEKMKSQKITVAVIVGLFIGIAIWSAAQGKFLLTVGLFIVALGIGSRHARKLKQIQAEISRRDTVQ
jgi:uncharacterized membrane protein YbjE (DUF340 family)